MRILTLGLWTVSLAALGIAAFITVEMGFMATSLDPIDLATDGLDPWTNALVAGSCFVGLAVTTAIALTLWHSVRFKMIGLLLTTADVGCVAWASVLIYREYF